ncbi:hypothetical protein IWW34DRAFT_834135 [Fusarium oxysporum f. sp. albedinis]|jgi:hypothetical protein|uniref:F-box domain-containing protein n=3 Tax=Fusarium oxysporum TaxID=5507 RepID=A0A2H3GQR0_FUSOX|nr:hypothetical protein FOMA001_g12291 [Fusarium oxysporum f. sp. matthiolae]KAI3578195.1 hypothetical protein IWW34DRAFT_834135 [Fusarium oxysporum f. sp. albedinis]PCD29154.1 hypothetical protein AU210_011695 [Fusarium oxysporum f. sp. radicis-cucumerinum]RKK13275.1 hypothetical protein BFJ65_g12510 [Fusarium oxysporum f. sp. cepae]RKL02022.1 hypothetical protein BFJ71_g4900 [Fusarium oxysporum]
MRKHLRRFFNHLRRRPALKGLKEDSRGDLIRIPPEIILQVTEFLPNGSLISLSLTCYAYHALLSGITRNVKLEGMELEEFLQLLEKDCASSYLCYTCVRLHQRDRRGKTDPCKCYKWDCKKNCLYHFHFYLWIDSGLMMTYPDVRLIMNRHFNGPTHGLSLDTLNYHGDIFRYEDGGTERWTSFARIIQDELFVQRTLAIWHPGDLGVQELLDRFSFPICLHISSNTKRYEDGYARIGLYTLPELVELSGGFKSYDGSLGSCPICFTDYSITVRWGTHQRQGWHIEVVSYQQLGSCRSPYDWKWRLAAEDCTWNEPRCRTQKPGLVRQRWMWPGGFIQPEGKYVGKARRQPGSLLGSRRCPWGLSCEYEPECKEHYAAEENHQPPAGLFRSHLTWWYPTEA